ncbi:hypothetical protein [Yersinia mollaretii]|uniref:hypothetical protein n=1 Tax=Yersinia mollaretii TaxID=33060 RepID=UPI001643E751|nr:hypothetical protein [Yersinia mollaretii]
MKLKAENNVLSATASILGLMRVNQTPEQVAKSPVVYSDKMDRKTPWVIKVDGEGLTPLNFYYFSGARSVLLIR